MSDMVIFSRKPPYKKGQSMHIALQPVETAHRAFCTICNKSIGTYEDLNAAHKAGLLHTAKEHAEVVD